MLKKVLPLVVMGLGAHEYDKKSGKKMAKKVAKKKLKASKCSSCGGKGCSKCASGSVGQGKYK